MSIKIIGNVDKRVCILLGIMPTEDTRIYIGDSNVEHMKRAHPEAFEKYGDYLSLVLERPDFVGLNPADGSIEYVKEFQVEQDFVKVAVRLSGSNRYFARSLYVLNPTRTNNFIKKGTLKKY